MIHIKADGLSSGLDNNNFSQNERLKSELPEHKSSALSSLNTQPSWLQV